MILDTISEKWVKTNYPIIKGNNVRSVYIDQLLKTPKYGIEFVNKGDVAAIIGDFDVESIATLLALLDKGAIVVPLSLATQSQHEYFLKESHCQHVFFKNNHVRLLHKKKQNILLARLKQKENPGLIFFTSGSTGKPKAILHDFSDFQKRYKSTRPPLRALSFLLFDHIGGINTLFHLLFNRGQVISPEKRDVSSVLHACNKFSVELLPTTPTFLRMLNLYPNFEDFVPNSMKIITYGTEIMDKFTLNDLTAKLPSIQFKQTYGLSELGILRTKSKSNNSIYFKFDDDIKVREIDKILCLNTKHKMLGYLNHTSPFDDEGWYTTNDIIKRDEDGYLTIVGRKNNIINVGGQKFMPSEIEQHCIKLKFVKNVKAIGKTNPITGQHVELIVEFVNDANESKVKKELIDALKKILPRHMMPLKIKVQPLNVSHRFKTL